MKGKEQNRLYKNQKGNAVSFLFFTIFLLIINILIFIFFSLNVFAVHVVFKMPYETLEADLDAKWGLFFTDEEDNLLKDGSQLCIGDKVFVRKKAEVNWFFTGGQTQCPDAYFITSSEMNRLYCKNTQYASCPNALCYPNGAYHRYDACPWKKLGQDEPQYGDIYWEKLDDAQIFGRLNDYSCLNLNIKMHVIPGNLQYGYKLDKHIMNIICNGTTSSGEDVATVSKEPIDSGLELNQPGDYVLDASTVNTIIENATIYCIFWHAWSLITQRNDCLRNARACLPQNYFPVTLEPEYSSITIHVIDPDLKLELSNLKLEKDNEGSAILSFKLKNIGNNDAKIKDLFVLDKDENKLGYDVIIGDFEINKSDEKEIVLKIKNRFCELADKDLFLSIKYSGNPEIYCHGKPYFGSIKEKIPMPEYPAYNISLGVINSTILVGNLSVGDSILFERNELISQINEFLRNCDSAECIVPINISISNEAALLITNLRVSYSECLLLKEIVANMLACWEKASFGNMKKDLMCYQLAVPKECANTRITADDLAEIMINNELCDVLGFSKKNCGTKDQVDFELNKIMEEGDNILIEYKNGKIVVS